jgi:hypothetical protein
VTHGVLVRSVRIEVGRRLVTLPSMDHRPPLNPAKLLDSWMEWQSGETPPGRVMSNLKTGGLRELLESMVEAD